MQSEQINELAAALAKAQGAIKGAAKDTANPFFKSKYADLASVWDACRTQLTANGLSVIQTMDDSQGGVTVVTTLAHSSGQWIRGRLTMKPVKDDPQGIGSAITYARRYALAAMVGVAPEDDDGNAASGRNNNANVPDVQPTPKKDPIAPWRGPLTKTELQKRVRALVSDINACDDTDQLESCLESYKLTIDQCRTDMPDWWSGEAHDGFVPLEDRINGRREVLKNIEFKEAS